MTHFQNLAKDRASRTNWKPIRDISQSVGVPLYSFSFSLNRFRSIKPVNLGCGVSDWDAVEWEFYYLRQLKEFTEKVENISPSNGHPLIQLGPTFLPEVVSHQLNTFKFRYVT